MEIPTPAEYNRASMLTQAAYTAYEGKMYEFDAATIRGSVAELEQAYHGVMDAMSAYLDSFLNTRRLWIRLQGFDPDADLDHQGVR